VANRFNHFNGHKFIVLALNIAIITQMNLHLAAQTCRCHLLPGVVKLLLGKRNSGDFAAGSLRAINSQATPAGTNFQ
jgi:hypothetical protein